ncbi:MAG: cell division protein FtsA, partial [Sphingobacteriales bacterium]
MSSNDIVVGLDIGTTKICAIVGRKNEYGKIDILGMGKAESAGVTRGVVTNIQKTVSAIQEAVKIAAEKSNVDIKVVHVGIAGQHIKSLRHRGVIVRGNGEDEIGNEDITRLVEDMHRLVMQPGEEIIHVFPQEYTVDAEHGIKDPIGMAGVRLEGNFHIITGQVTAAKNIYRCVTKAGLQVADLVLEPIASSEAVLTEEEKEHGVALIDIGGGTTDLAIFQDGIIRHTAVVPLGGNIITEDIKEGCSVMRKQADALKVRFGSALADEAKENEIISIPGLRGREPREISVKNLAYIIQ